MLTDPAEGTTRHMSFRKIRQMTRLGVVNQLQTDPSAAAVTRSRTIFPSMQVLTVLFQITLFRKTMEFFFLRGSNKRKRKKKVTGVEAINACVAWLCISGSLLMVRSRVPARLFSFIGRSTW